MIAISLFLCCTNELHTQAVQTVNVGIAFVEFGDADTNPDARGGVGYTVEIDNERQLDTSKYDWHFWYDFFFKHEGHVSHPDSVSHTGPEYWTGDYSLFYPMSVARWCNLNSSGRHKLAPFHSESRSYDGILNEIADGKIAWLRLDSAKQYYSGANFSYNNTLARDTRERLNSIQDTSGTPLQSYCDVVFIVYAGTSMYNLTAEDSTGRLWACVLSEKTTHPADDTLDYRDDFINFSLAAFTHEYIHAISDIYLDPAEHQGVNAILDYGYDKSRFTPWIGLSGMYTYGASNKPYHLDPWAKLLLGWIDHDMLGYGEYFDRELPVIDDETASSAPEVAVIPIDVPWDPADPVWYRGHYLIIENRRIPENGPDSRIVPGDSLVGGFLVWEYDDRLTEGERGGLTVVEADGRYDLKYRVKAKNPGLGPSIDDFWGDSTSLSTWSDHLLGLHDPDSLRAPSHELSFQRTIPRQITIRFGPYSASGSSNIIPYISGGKPTSNNPAATRNNNQRKLIKNSDRLTFVCTDYLGGDTTKPMICLHEMEENGQSWSSYEILSDVSVYDTLATEPWNPRIGNIVANPAIARIAEDWGVAWQEKVADSENIVRFRKSGADSSMSAAGPILRSDGDVTPVIAWKEGLVKIVYCSDSGLYSVRSTDLGATWSTPPVKIANTRATTTHPSLEMSAYHEVLVYQDEDTVYVQLDSLPRSSLDAIHPSILSSTAPSVTLTHDINVAWVMEAEVLDPDSGKWVNRKMPALLHTSVGHPEPNVLTAVKSKYGHVEIAEAPVMAANETEFWTRGALVWSVNDSAGGGVGSRLRYSYVANNQETGKVEAAREAVESSLSGYSTFNPAVAGSNGQVSMLVTQQRDGFCRLPVGTLPEPEGNIFEGDREVTIDVKDLGGAGWQNRILFHQPFVASGGTLFKTADVAGIPDTGYDGTSDGPRIVELSKSTDFVVSEDDTVFWRIDVRRYATNCFSDTSVFQMRMYDAQSDSLIALGSAYLVPPSKNDTSMVMCMVLPADLYPMHEVTVALDVGGDAYDSGSRYYSSILFTSQDGSMAKQAVAGSNKRQDDKRIGTVTTSPQPAFNNVFVTLEYWRPGIVDAALFSILGKRLASKRIDVPESGSVETSFDTRSLSSGVYLIRLTGAGQQRVIPIIVR